MNTKIVIVVLAVAVLGLGISLFVVKNQDDQRHAADVTDSLNLSNDLSNTSASLEAEKQVNLALTNDLLQARQQGVELANTLTNTQVQLERQTQATQTSQASLTTAQDKISGLDKRVAELEADNTALDQRAAELTNTIALLNGQIKDIQNQLSDTQGKLADTRSDKTYLEHQLDQLREQKADLEHKFNDLVTVRNQYKKLKTEAFINNRIQLDRATASTAGKKGGELLIQHTRTTEDAGSARSPHYDLNVEVGSDGSVHIIPPAATGTNSGAH